MSGIDKDFRGIYQFVFVAFREDMLKDLFKQVGVLKAAGVVFSEGGKMRDRLQHVQAKKPAVGDIDLDLFDCLPHTSYPVQILDERDLDQRDRIHAWSPEIWRIFIFDKIIDERPVDGLID